MFDTAYHGSFSADERSNSLVAFLRAIRFTRSGRAAAAADIPARSFARPQQQAPRPATANPEPDCIRSGN